MDSATAPKQLLSRTLVVGALVFAVVMASLSPAAYGVPAIDEEAAASSSLEMWRERRQEAETRLAEATAQKAALTAELERLEDGAAQITQDIAEAKAQVREYAVEAYIDGGQSAILGEGLDASENAQAAWHTEMAASLTADTTQAVDRYEALKRSNDPERVEVAARLDEATALVDTAQSDAIQAAAHERDAEVALTRLREAERRNAAASASAAASTVASSPASESGSASRRSTATTAAAPATSATSASGSPTARESALLAKIRHCESRGNYQIVSSSGRYRGAYQFDTRTWAGVGGAGDPAAASPAEQDYRALLLLRQRGTRPWPNCA